MLNIYRILFLGNQQNEGETGREEDKQIQLGTWGAKGLESMAYGTTMMSYGIPQ